MSKIRKVISEAVSDNYLVQQIRNDNYSAMELFFKRHYLNLCRFGSTYEKNECVVEEKIADVFIELWKNRKTLDKINNPKSYIYVIAKNRLKKIDKFELSRQNLNENHIKDSMSFPSREDEMIDFENSEISSHLINSILKYIPKKSRQVFELSRIDGLKYKEIAEILNISSKTVENHIALAMRIISDVLSMPKTKTFLKEYH